MDYRTKRIDKQTAKAVIEAMHYRKTLGVFWEAFGLYEDNKLMGVVCYGQPSAPIQKHAFANRGFRLYELTRLVIDGGNKKQRKHMLSKLSYPLVAQYPKAPKTYYTVVGGCNDAIA